MKLRVATVQFAPEKGAIEANITSLGSIVSQCAQDGVDLVVFPESATTSYYLQGGVDEQSMSAEELGEALSHSIVGLKEPIDVCIGFYERGDGRTFNSALYATFSPDGWELVHCYRKFFLPSYRVFDEKRYIQPGDEMGVFDTRFGKIGVLICEDLWHSALRTALALHGATILLVLVASPGRGFQGAEPSNIDRYRRMLQGAAEEHGSFVISSMLVGFEEGRGMAGGSRVFGPFGDELVCGPIQDEHIAVAEIDLEDCAIARSQMPLLDDLRQRLPQIVEFLEATTTESD